MNKFFYDARASLSKNPRTLRLIFLSFLITINLYFLVFWMVTFIPEIKSAYPLWLSPGVLSLFLVFCFAHKEGIINSLFRKIVICGCLFLAAFILTEILSAPFYHWNSTRLAWPFSLKYGYKLYYGSGQGPVLARMYGPMMPLSYALALAFSTPAPAICFASWLSVVFAFGPALFILQKECQAERCSQAVFIISIIVFSFLVLATPGLRMSCFMVHADAPAIGLAGLACLFLMKKKENKRNFFWSAAFGVLSVWAKQLSAPLLLCLPVYLYFADGRKAAIQHLKWTMILLAATTFVFSLAFGAWPLYFEMFYIPMRQPLQLFKKPLLVVLASFTDFFLTLGIFVFLVAACHFRDKKIYALKEFFLYRTRDGEAWLLFFLIAILMIPLAALGKLKISGDINNYSFSFYFFALALTMSAIKIWKGLLSDGQPATSVNIRKGLFIITLSFAIQSLLGSFIVSATSAMRIKENPQSIVYQLSRNHPGEFYFPDNILSSLLAEAKLYHSTDGIIDRADAAIPLRKEHFFNHVPKNLKAVALPREYPERHFYSKAIFPELSRRQYLPILSSFTFYGRGE